MKRELWKLQRRYLGILALAWIGVVPRFLFAESFYYDGDRRVEIQEVGNLLAEKTDLTEDTEGRASLVRRVDRSASLSRKYPGLRIWKTDALATRSAFARQMKGGDWENRFLPVYRTSLGNLLIPTGNLIVYVQTDASDEKVRAWAAGKGLRALEKLPLALKNAWVIESPPGRKSIQLANSLREDPFVVSATPNFWTEFAKK